MIYLTEQSATPDNRAAAHELLLRGLREEYGLTPPLSFAHTPNGKPYLPGYPHIHFNLSHCRLGAACVVADRDVGIDMQDVRAFTVRAARRVCTAAELARLADSSEPEKLFCMLWAVKEAYVKWQGGSIMVGVVDTDAVLADAFLYEGNNYYLCCFGCDQMDFSIVY